MTKYSFPRGLRLLTPEDYSKVFEQPVRSSSPEITILAKSNSLGFPRLGLAIAKKQIKHAHQRNRIKRLCREYFRLNRDRLPSMDFVILVRKDVLRLDHQAFFQIMEKLCNRHRRLAQKS